MSSIPLKLLAHKRLWETSLNREDWLYGAYANPIITSEAEFELMHSDKYAVTPYHGSLTGKEERMWQLFFALYFADEKFDCQTILV